MASRGWVGRGKLRCAHLKERAAAVHLNKKAPAYFSKWQRLLSNATVQVLATRHLYSLEIYAGSRLGISVEIRDLRSYRLIKVHRNIVAFFIRMRFLFKSKYL